jgi:hypothetical protein
MAESTLSETRNDIAKAVARYLDFGYVTESELSGDDLTEVQEAIKEGYRDALAPDALPEDAARGIPPHTWSFLKPVRTLTTVADDYAYDLADDEAGIFGDYISFSDTTSAGDLQKRTEGWIRLQQQGHTGSSRPEYFAVRYKDDAGSGQRLEVLLYPTPDAEYTLSYRALLNVDALSATEYPPGGMRHTAMFRASCIAAAEFRRNNAHGPMFEELVRQLRKSVALDRQIELPDSIGTMTYGGAEAGDEFRSPGMTVTFEGTDYSVQDP